MSFSLSVLARSPTQELYVMVGSYARKINNEHALLRKGCGKCAATDKKITIVLPCLGSTHTSHTVKI